MKPAHALTAALVVSTALAGCQSTKPADGTPSTTATASAVGSASTSATCPTESTRKFAKTRFVADVGLAAGSFHRWIYKPYKAGTFKQGATGNRLAIVKAVATAAADVKLLQNAYANVQADPGLCRALGEPLKKVSNSFEKLQDDIRNGKVASIADAESQLSTLLDDSKAKGLPITETTEDARTQ